MHAPIVPLQHPAAAAAGVITLGIRAPVRVQCKCSTSTCALATYPKACTVQLLLNGDALYMCYESPFWGT